MNTHTHVNIKQTTNNSLNFKEKLKVAFKTLKHLVQEDCT